MGIPIGEDALQFNASTILGRLNPSLKNMLPIHTRYDPCSIGSLSIDSVSRHPRLIRGLSRVRRQGNPLHLREHQWGN